MGTMLGATVDTDGCSVIADFLQPRDVDYLLRNLTESHLARSRAGVRHALRHPAFAELSSDPRLLAIAGQVLDAPAIPFHATLFHKSPRSNWLVVWHQDTALPLKERKEKPGWGPWSVKDDIHYAHAPAEALQEVVALRVHLDESNEDNGPLRILPGTHNLGVLADSQIEELVATSATKTCTVPLGGVLAMRPLLIHSSSKCRSERPRCVLHIEYTASLRLDGMDLATD